MNFPQVLCRGPCEDGIHRVVPEHSYSDILLSELIQRLFSCAGIANSPSLDAHAHRHIPSGKVFVEYDSKESAQKAALSLAGRQFGQNIVKVEYVNEEKFARRDFD